jgi:hypothetical protein
MKRKSRIPPPEIETGHVWQLADSTIHITLAGRTLVHFKRIPPGRKAGIRTSLLGRSALGEFLTNNDGVLVQM